MWNVATTGQPMTTVANGRCTSAPAPLLSAMGKANGCSNAVINTGLNPNRCSCDNYLADVFHPFLLEPIEFPQ